MAEQVQFELVAPEGTLASEQVDMVVVPGAEGDFGILPEHAPLLSLLRPGIISTYRGDRVEKRIFVAGGFAEANPHGCIVLAENAQALDQIDSATAQEALKNAQDDLADAKDPSELERARLERALAVAQARLEAIATAQP
jgi:F-type H+-transporting ATPase subunit epsilon